VLAEAPKAEHSANWHFTARSYLKGMLRRYVGVMTSPLNTALPLRDEPILDFNRIKEAVSGPVESVDRRGHFRRSAVNLSHIGGILQVALWWGLNLMMTSWHHVPPPWSGLSCSNVSSLRVLTVRLVEASGKAQERQRWKDGLVIRLKTESVVDKGGAGQVKGHVEGDRILGRMFESAQAFLDGTHTFGEPFCHGIIFYEED
jgi:hypothetical protein